MEQFRVFDITGDAGITAFGKTEEELFVNAAMGMYSLITDLSRMEEKENLSISLERDSREALFISWLNELVFHFDTNGFIGRKIVVTGLSCTSNYARLKASLSGDIFDPARHEGKLLIKAATFHKLRIEQAGDAWQADVIFDI